MPQPRRKATAAPAPITLASLREAKRYVWRNVPRFDDKPPLRVKVLDLNIRESEEIPVGVHTPLRDAMKAIGPYVVEWDLEAENLNTGEMMAVPAPGSGEAATAITGEGNEWELLTLVDDYTVNQLIVWLKNPSYMSLQERSQKNSKTSASGDDSTDGDPKASK